MADISTDIASWSASAGSNQPQGGTSVGAGLDDNLRAIQAALVLAYSAKGSDIASASSIDLSATNGLFHDVTGTTAITALGTVRAGVWKVLKFEGALTLTHNSTSLILPTAANITTADGDIAMVVSEGSGNWRCTFYSRANGQALAFASASETVAGIVELATQAEVDAMTDTARAITANHNKIILGTEQASTSGVAIDFTSIPAGVRRVSICFDGVSVSGTSIMVLQLGDSGGIENAAYKGSVGNYAGTVVANHDTYFQLTTAGAAAHMLHGVILLTLMDATNNQWIADWNIGRSDAGTGFMGAGSKSLSAVLDRIRLTTVNGTDTFDAGSINISYER